MVNSEVQTATGKGVTTAACGKVKKAGMFKCPYQTNAGHNSTPINVQTYNPLTHVHPSSTGSIRKPKGNVDHPLKANLSSQTDIMAADLHQVVTGASLSSIFTAMLASILL